MNEREWSDQKPPAWQGTPLGETPPTPPELVSSAPAAYVGDSLIPRSPMTVSQMLTLIWPIFIKQRTAFFSLAWRGAAIVAVLIAPTDYFLNLQVAKLNWAPSDSANPVRLEDIPPGVFGWALAAIIFAAIVQYVAQSWLTVTSGNQFLTEARDSQKSAGTVGLPAYLSTLLLCSLIVCLMFAPTLFAALFNPTQAGIRLAVGLGLATTPFVIWFVTGLLPLAGVILVERKTGIVAIRRSLSLARSARWPMLATVFVVSFLTGIIGSAVSTFANLLPAMDGFALAIVNAVMAAISIGISTPFVTIAMLLTYANRRLQVEPPAADVFTDA